MPPKRPATPNAAAVLLADRELRDLMEGRDFGGGDDDFGGGDGASTMSEGSSVFDAPSIVGDLDGEALERSGARDGETTASEAAAITCAQAATAVLIT